MGTVPRKNPTLSLALAAGGSIVLALAIHAPWMALIPVLFLLFLFLANRVLGRWKAFGSPARRGWALLILVLVVVETGGPSGRVRLSPELLLRG